MFSETGLIFIVSTISLLSIVILLVNGLCRNGTCCKKTIKENRIEGAGNVGNNYELENGEPKDNSPVGTLSRDSNGDTDRHLYADVIKSEGSLQKANQPNIGYVPMEVLKISPRGPSPNCQVSQGNSAKHLYVNDIFPPNS